MSLPVKLRSSQSAPNLFSDWNNLLNDKFVFQKIGEGEGGSQKKKKERSEIGIETDSNDVNPIEVEKDWVSRLNYFDSEKLSTGGELQM
jgi:hypothetical protein